MDTDIRKKNIFIYSYLQSILL